MLTNVKIIEDGWHCSVCKCEISTYAEKLVHLCKECQKDMEGDDNDE